MNPTREEVMSASGEALDRMVEQWVMEPIDPNFIEFPPHWVEKFEWLNAFKKLSDRLAARNLGPAFAAELASIVHHPKYVRDIQENMDEFTASELWALLSASPTDVCRASVLACLTQGEG